MPSCFVSNCVGFKCQFLWFFAVASHFLFLSILSNDVYLNIAPLLRNMAMLARGNLMEELWWLVIKETNSTFFIIAQGYGLGWKQSNISMERSTTGLGWVSRSHSMVRYATYITFLFFLHRASYKLHHRRMYFNVIPPCGSTRPLQSLFMTCRCSCEDTLFRVLLVTMVVSQFERIFCSMYVLQFLWKFLTDQEQKLKALKLLSLGVGAEDTRAVHTILLGQGWVECTTRSMAVPWSSCAGSSNSDCWGHGIFP